MLIFLSDAHNESEISLNQLQRFYYAQWRMSGEATWLSEAMALEQETEDGLDDHCAVCGQRGLLVCCDQCSNVYHLACVKLTEVPDRTSTDMIEGHY